MLTELHGGAWTGPARWPEAPAPGLAFPYMVWARTRSHAARLNLTQSGMPTADASLFAGLPPVDLGFPAVVLDELETALARRFRVPRERVVATLGASGGLHACAWTWFRPGTRVVADLPSYEPFRALPQRLGAELSVLERRLDDGWRIDPDEVRARLASAAGPGHVFLANVHNPTGAQLGRERLSAIAYQAERTGGVLVSCDIYAEYEPDPVRTDAFRAAPNAVSIGSLTKAYGLGPLRIGWVVLGEGLAHEAERLRDATYLAWVDAPTVALRAGVHALGNLAQLRAPYERIVRESRPLWAEWLRGTEGVRALVPDHGIVAFARVDGAHDTFALSQFLAREYEVGVVPGEFFGLPAHLRVGCALPPAQLGEALGRLTEGLAAWRSGRR